jgi:predicted DsbA family dithiol-disulfide isomerase
MTDQTNTVAPKPAPVKPVPIKIDFVSDVSCPWCAIGLASLRQALANLGGEVAAEIHFQPFELNPQMPLEGENSTEHLMRKYGSTAEQIDANRENIRARGEPLGVTFRMDRNSRVYNTFDAHRLLHWAELERKHVPLKQVMLRAYFTDGDDVSDHAAAAAGRRSRPRCRRGRAILTGDTYADDVRAQEQFYLQRGIQSVPATIINDRHLISGGQPPEAFEQALRQIANPA